MRALAEGFVRLDSCAIRGGLLPPTESTRPTHRWPLLEGRLSDSGSEEMGQRVDIGFQKYDRVEAHD